MFQSEKKLSGSTQKMNKTDTWVINTLTNVSIWKEVVCSTQKMNKIDTWVINYFNKCFNLKRSCLVYSEDDKTDTWVINYFNKCFNLKRSCLVLLRSWTRQILGSSTTSTNVSIWKKLSGSTQKMNKTDTWVINYFNKCFNQKRICLVLLRRWTRQILGSSTTLTNVSIWKEVVWFYSEDEQDRYLSHQLL